jgi:hypothetical protein
MRRDARIVRLRTHAVQVRADAGVELQMHVTSLLCIHVHINIVGGGSVPSSVHRVAYREERDVECAASQIEYKNILHGLALVKPVGKRRGCRLVDDPEHG